MSSSFGPLLVATGAFVAGLLVIARLEKWADLVSGVLGVAALALGILVATLAVTPRGMQEAVVTGDPITGALMVLPISGP
ncbi:hypothetical protein Mnod_7598 [Methylobacterium nodulans ORS 2060]|uniref:Uncharacterized protein n=1 Tax=Methylobacterium nodulans (strain LMG 21967 / CNCM I-2342 / ORS 2060) TaxID=460265 RepID=B8IPP2_METNO|nr:hypothetical protein Mnod_7598 [Methylobacterium nodulans ORS 2060]